MSLKEPPGAVTKPRRQDRRAAQLAGLRLKARS